MRDDPSAIGLGTSTQAYDLSADRWFSESMAGARTQLGVAKANLCYRNEGETMDKSRAQTLSPLVVGSGVFPSVAAKGPWPFSTPGPSRRSAGKVETILVPAGDPVKLTLVNQDADPHNLSLYRSEAATDKIFVGEIFTGPDRSKDYRFETPEEPGSYFFRCDVHPVQMTGRLEAQ